MIAGLTGFHLIVIVAVVALIFGGAKLPMFAKNLGQSAKILRREVRSLHDDDQEPQPAPVATAVRTDAAPAEAVRVEPRS
ncbi:MAG: sec-independent protein translocase protein TatA [Microbacteriaceae bacterium]|jgi:sec-independent protein translocase protein TatA|nr:sec-independent protein translocase protein TatA [Microbacteriaceae bacterium]